MFVQRDRRLGSAPRARSWRAKATAASTSPKQRRNSRECSKNTSWHRRFSELSSGNSSYVGPLTNALSSSLATVVQEAHIRQTISIIHATASLQDLCKGNGTKGVIWRFSHQLNIELTLSSLEILLTIVNWTFKFAQSSLNSESLLTQSHGDSINVTTRTARSPRWRLKV